MTDHKAIVRRALHELFVQRDPTALDRYWGDPYIQHNPTIPDGVAALRPLLSATESFETHRVIADGEFVVTHSVARGWGPDPMVVFDIFLLRDGRMVEHWDVMQPWAASTASGRTQVDGPTEVVEREATEQNRALVQAFFDTVMYGGRAEAITEFISPTTYEQHNPGVADGLQGFGAAMAELAKAGLTMRYAKTYRIVAEGNFVFTHSEGEFAGRHVAFADLFRIEGGRIVEHWDCIQEVASGGTNDNGMFERVTR